MRILILHSRYLSGDVSGENRVVGDEARLLREAGHDVTLRELRPAVSGLRQQAMAAATTVWARRVAADVAETVRRERIEVVHAHNLFPTVSPAVLPAAREAGAAVVMTLHNYRLLCLPATLLRDGRPCTLCVGHVPWQGVRHACYRGSRAGSAVLAGSLTLHRALGSFDAVRRFLAVSAFVRDRHVEGGLDADRIVVKPNFAWPSTTRTGAGEGFLYLGRVAREKGLDTLLDAWRASRGLGRLTVAGDGPDLEELRRGAPEGVEFLGAVEADRVPSLIERARAVLVPSRWEEPAVPKVVLEASATGVGVIASAVGALSEGVDDGVSGLLVAADDPATWSDALRRLHDDATAVRLGEGARAAWEARWAPEGGLRALEAVYAEAVA